MVTRLVFGGIEPGSCACHVELELAAARPEEQPISVRLDAAMGSAIIAERAGCPSAHAAFIDLLHVAIQAMGGKLAALMVDDGECQQAWLRVAMPARVGALGPIPPGVGLLVAARRNLPIYRAEASERLGVLDEAEMPGAIAEFLDTIDFSVLAPGEACE